MTLELLLLVCILILHLLSYAVISKRLSDLHTMVFGILTAIKQMRDAEDNDE